MWASVLWGSSLTGSVWTVVFLVSHGSKSYFTQLYQILFISQTRYIRIMLRLYKVYWRKDHPDAVVKTQFKKCRNSSVSASMLWGWTGVQWLECWHVVEQKLSYCDTMKAGARERIMRGCGAAGQKLPTLSIISLVLHNSKWGALGCCTCYYTRTGELHSGVIQVQLISIVHNTQNFNFCWILPKSLSSGYLQRIDFWLKMNSHRLCGVIGTHDRREGERV